MQQIKGAVLKSRLAFIEDKFGADALRRVLAAVPGEDRAELESLLTIRWYPFDLGTRLDDAIVAVCAKGDPAFFKQLGASSADRNLGGMHKSFLTPGDPHAFLAKAPAVYRLYYQTGYREYQKSDDTGGVVITHDAETFSAPDCLTVIGWYERALQMCGAQGVRIVEEECRARGGAVCRYRMSWTGAQA